MVVAVMVRAVRAVDVVGMVRLMMGSGGGAGRRSGDGGRGDGVGHCEVGRIVIGGGEVW